MTRAEIAQTLKNRMKQARQEMFAKKNKVTFFGLFGNGASGILRLAAEDSQWEYTYKFIGVFTDNAKASGTPHLEQLGIPCHCIDWETFHYKERKQKYGKIFSNFSKVFFPKKTLSEKDLFFRRLAEIIDGYNPNFIVCSGFMLILPEWFIRKFNGKILNIHPADLCVLETNTGKRKYTGRGSIAIGKTMADGLKTICSTIAFVEEGPIDGGKIIAQSILCTIFPGDTVESVQQRLKMHCDWRALQCAIKKITEWQWPLNMFQHAHFEQ